MVPLLTGPQIRRNPVFYGSGPNFPCRKGECQVEIKMPKRELGLKWRSTGFFYLLSGLDREERNQDVGRSSVVLQPCLRFDDGKYLVRGLSSHDMA
mmetsp:Transcript_14307/g.29322  ORF Transcript_14307/g.29322 Transcript_14307/m.29322 type:complete len:96 (-) Transcript_14307:899-1186(-)